MTWIHDYDPDHGRDEDDVRVRPNPRGSKPRTKRRPTHDQAQLGMVTEVHLARYQVRLDTGESVRATLAKELRREGAVVGDRVRVVGEVEAGNDGLMRVVLVEPRQHVLRRSAEDGDAEERPIVSNADTLVMVTAAADPEPRARLIDRLLVAAYGAGMRPILCVTKCDLRSPDEFLAQFADLGFPIVKSQGVGDNEAAEALRQLLAGNTSVFVGHSGVGKSTLVNTLVPESGRAIGRVNDTTGRGRHTSSSALALEFEGGWIIDTPGVRSFGLSGLTPEAILQGFEDLREISAENCPRDCSHADAAPDCALDEAVESGNLPQSRVYSFRRLLGTAID